MHYVVRATVRNMIRESQQRIFCRSIWETLGRSRTTIFSDLHPMPAVAQDATILVRHDPLSVFRDLPVSEQYLETHTVLPSAIIRLGRGALLAVSLQQPVYPLGTSKRLTESIACEVVSLEFDRHQTLAVLLSGDAQFLNRHTLRQVTGYAYSDVSRSHASIAVDGTAVTIRDLGSSNGTEVATEYHMPKL